jgi:AbrB family looped-hinge helix DNA binding protein
MLVRERCAMSDERSIDEMFFGSVTVGERGQIVIPADARHKYSISPGEKLLVFGHPEGAGLMLVKMSRMSRFIEMMKGILARAERETPLSDEAEAPG